MKRVVLTLLLFLGMAVGADAQVMRFRTTDLHIRTYEDGAWGDYKHKGVFDARVVMDLEDDMVTIYTPDVQVYNIHEYEDAYEDSDGDTVIRLHFTDNDGDNGILRLIERASGQMQLYIDFDEIKASWAYDIERTN